MNTMAQSGFKTTFYMLSGLILFSGCAKQSPPLVLRTSDAAMGRLAQQGKTLFEMQRPAQAAPLYQAALDRARALNDDTAIARLAYNLGACRLESGDAAGASAALQEARQAAQTEGLPHTESLLLLGHAFLQQGETDQTLALCDSTLETLKGSTDLDMRLRFQLLKAETYVRTDQIDNAEQMVQTVRQHVTSQTAPAIQAQCAKIQGILLAQEEHSTDSGEAFLQEAHFWTEANRPLDVASALIRAANELQKAKKIPAEADSRYRAARALLGLGRLTEASAQLDRLEALPQSGYPESLLQLVPLLRQEINQRASKKTGLP